MKIEKIIVTYGETRHTDDPWHSYKRYELSMEVSLDPKDSRSYYRKLITEELVREVKRFFEENKYKDENE
ncbi:hypothetical protein [Rosettibacter firmus]|uniref:hypothetical protein n=1 Tax=Rosettibacter firmus TaxID=3111522 RepID=UPI00317520E3